jgi:hypothetical protein
MAILSDCILTDTTFHYQLAQTSHQTVRTSTTARCTGSAPCECNINVLLIDTLPSTFLPTIILTT